MPSSAKKKRKAPRVTRAFHASNEGGDAIVGLKNLHVLITRVGGAWFAQGLEIDYGVEGPSLAKVKSRFETGLALTIRSYLANDGSIDGVLRVAPESVWSVYRRAPADALRMTHSQMSFHAADDLKKAGFTGVSFLEPKAA